MQTAATMEIVIVIVVLNFLFFIFSRPFFSDFFHSIIFLFVCIDLSRTIFDLLRTQKKTVPYVDISNIRYCFPLFGTLLGQRHNFRTFLLHQLNHTARWLKENHYFLVLFRKSCCNSVNIRLFIH